MVGRHDLAVASEHESGQRPRDDEHRPAAAALIAKLGELKPDTELIPDSTRELSTPNCRFDDRDIGRIVPPGREMELAVDLQWTGWSAYKALNVAFNEKELGIKPIYSVKNYSNTLAFRFGAQYRATDFITARMGMYGRKPGEQRLSQPRNSVVDQGLPIRPV